MKNTTSRRYFIRNSAMAIAGFAVLSPPGFAHALTDHESPYLGYNPYAESISDLRSGFFNSNSVTVKGVVFDKNSTSPLSNAQVEVWHLSPNASKYRHRGKLVTNGSGEYEFITDFPDREPGKCARIYFKISTSEASYFTELALSTHGPHITSKHWEENQGLGNKLFPKKEILLNNQTIQFNISI